MKPRIRGYRNTPRTEGRDGKALRQVAECDFGGLRMLMLGVHVGLIDRYWSYTV